MSALTQPIFHDGFIDLYAHRRVCARCYGDLESRPAAEDTPQEHLYVAYCPICEETWHFATVSRYYAERLGQKAIADLWDVKHNLADLFSRARQSEMQILEALGY